MIGPALKNARDAHRCFYGGFKGAGEVVLPYGRRGEQSLMGHLAPDVRERDNPVSRLSRPPSASP
jgi:hypothetical protein